MQLQISSIHSVVWCVYIIEIYKKGMFHVYCPNWVSKFAFRANNIQYRYTCRCTNVSFVTQNIIFYTPVFKTGRTLYYGIHCTNVWLSVRPFHMSRSNLRTPWPNFTELLELMVLRSLYFMVKFRIFIPELWDFIHKIVHDFKAIFRMSRCKLRTPLPNSLQTSHSYWNW